MSTGWARLTLPVVPSVKVPTALPPCPGLRGEPCRDYVPFQNEACCDLLNALVDESGAHFETAGSMRGGRRVFVTMKLPKTMKTAMVVATIPVSGP